MQLYAFIYVGPCDYINRPDITVGCRVQVIRDESVQRCLDYHIRLDGIVTAVLDRQAGVRVQFPDRLGEVFYSLDEVAWVGYE